MTRLLQTLIDGIGNGAIYASLGLALVLIHRATQIPNLAQGELAMVSAYIGWQLQETGLPWLDESALPLFGEDGWPWGLALLGAIVISFGFGFVLERGVIRWVEGSSPLTLLIVTLGFLTIANNGVGWRWGYLPRAVETPFPIRSVRIGGAFLPWRTIGLLIVLGGTLLCVYALFRFTKLGLGLRAAAMNPRSARLVGIRVGLMLGIGWGLSCAVGATAGVMAAPRLGGLNPNMLATIMIFAFASAVVGGFESPPGTVVGGFLVGLLQSCAATYWPAVGNDLSLVVALGVILAVLLLKPNGIFGRAEVSRV